MFKIQNKIISISLLQRIAPCLVTKGTNKPCITNRTASQ